MDLAIKMTGQMLRLASAGEFETFADLQSKREQLIKSAIPNDGSIAPESPLGQQIQTLLQMDQQIQDILINERNAVRDELIDMSQSQKKIKAYQQP